MHLSIRWRLTLWYTLALAVVLGGFSALVYGLVARSLYQHLDQVLVSEWHEVEHESNPDLVHWIKEIKENDNLTCVIFDSQGNVRLRTEALSAENIPDIAAFATERDQRGEITLRALGRQRFFVTQTVFEGQPVTLLLLAPLAEVDAELRQLLAVLGLAVPVCLVVAGGLGYLMARKALAPVDQLNRLTEEITADRLDRRLPVINARDELGQLARTINAMIGRLERSFAEIRRFTADASHELRTPLTAIRTEAEVALADSLTTEAYRQLLGSILEECERLTRLTDQLLTLSREDAGTIPQTRAPVDLAALLARVVDTMRPLAEVKGQRLEFAPGHKPRVPGDDMRLREVFYNLLDNAIKYTPDGGQIDIRLALEGRTAVVSVCDTGIGIAAEHLSRVFDRFYRVDMARSREGGGAGLGLSIARAIVTTHGGRIDLGSVPGRGTTCTVSFPLEEQNSEVLGTLGVY